MSAKGWYSKQDVIKDLEEVTGKCLSDFGEHYVVGENPPPRRRSDEDDEDLLRLYGGQNPMQSDTMEKPDLLGITQMLRMVDNYCEQPKFSSSNKENMKSKGTKNELTNFIVSISKLNPNVNNFVPCKLEKSATDSTESKVIKNDLEVNKDICVSNAVDTKKTDCCDNNLITNVDGNRIDISRLMSSELHEMRDHLKTKICNTSKVKLKQERNLAIATLLKLYCHQPVEENKPNLISPDYFKNNLANKKSVTEQNQVVREIKCDSLDNFVENNLNLSSEEDVIKKEIAASVEKVTRWLHNSESDKISEQNDTVIKEVPNITEMAIKKQIKIPSIYLGPVTFKRKTNNNLSESPVSLKSDTSRAKSDNFVPSVYASELTKKYIQQSNKRQETHTDIWKSLEIQMKKKDEAIKKKLQTKT